MDNLLRGNLINFVSYPLDEVPQSYEELERGIHEFHDKHYPDVRLGHSQIEDIAIDIFSDVKRQVYKRLNTQQELDKERAKQYADMVKAAVKDVNEKLKLKNHQSFEMMMKQDKFINLRDEDKRRIYEEYERIWNEMHPKVKKPKAGTIQRTYTNVRITDDMKDFINNTGFKSSNKVNAIVRNKYPDVNVSAKLMNELQTLPTNYFPLKKNKKKYSLKVVAPHKSYLIDLVFDQGLTYLVSIEINTRKYISCILPDYRFRL